MNPDGRAARRVDGPMGMVTQRALALVGILLHGAAASAAGNARPATGRPTTAVNGRVLASGSGVDLAVTRARGNTDVTVRRIVIPPGGSTGWHYHDGDLIAVVQSGTLTRVLHDCSVSITPPGMSFVERAGSEHVHLGRNLGTEPVVLYVTYLLPAGSPLAVEATDPGCGS